VLTFKSNGTIFTLRTAAVIINDESILLHRAGSNDFWSLPGGRINAMESSEEALLREMREELQVDIQVSRLLWLVEHFYRDNSTLNHEVGFYYLGNLPKTSDLLDTLRIYEAQDGDTTLKFRWHSLKTLSSITLYPVFLKTALLSIPQKPEFIIFRDPSLKT
jgi:ADP-ribose pyrophosphatase YjhB (NUDIX family)